MAVMGDGSRRQWVPGFPVAIYTQYNISRGQVVGHSVFLSKEQMFYDLESCQPKISQYGRMRNGILPGKLYYLCDIGILLLSPGHIIKKGYHVLMVGIKKPRKGMSVWFSKQWIVKLVLFILLNSTQC